MAGVSIKDLASFIALLNLVKCVIGHGRILANLERFWNPSRQRGHYEGNASYQEKCPGHLQYTGTCIYCHNNSCSMMSQRRIWWFDFLVWLFLLVFQSVYRSKMLIADVEIIKWDDTKTESKIIITLYFPYAEGVAFCPFLLLSNINGLLFLACWDRLFIKESCICDSGHSWRGALYLELLC
jgi:hypothetical protein